MQVAQAPGRSRMKQDHPSSSQAPGADRCHHHPIPGNSRGSAQPFSYKTKQLLHPGTSPHPSRSTFPAAPYDGTDTSTERWGLGKGH